MVELRGHRVFCRTDEGCPWARATHRTWVSAGGRADSASEPRARCAICGRSTDLTRNATPPMPTSGNWKRKSVGSQLRSYGAALHRPPLNTPPHRLTVPAETFGPTEPQPILMNGGFTPWIPSAWTTSGKPWPETLRPFAASPTTAGRRPRRQGFPAHIRGRQLCHRVAIH